MKTLAGCVLLLIFSATGLAQKVTENFGLPELHTIKTITLSPAYSCRSAEDFQKGYANTALFLSAYAKKQNSPDLLFNGACKADDDFEAATAGDDFSLIADLGADVSLEDVSASRAFNLNKEKPYANKDTSYPRSRFANVVKVVANHTYAVLLNESDKRGLFIFQVAEYVPNEKVVLRYAVKSYQITPNGQVVSQGFSWTSTNK
jgi:hypothetical protein